MSEDPRAAIGLTAVFNERAQAWRDWQFSPWGKLRYSLVARRR